MVEQAPFTPVIDGTKYTIRPGSYFKSEQPTGAVPTSGLPLDLRPVKEWAQTSWRGGVGQKTWRDQEMYHDGAIDSYTDPRSLRCLPAVSRTWQSATTTYRDKRVGVKFEVRGKTKTDAPALYFVVADFTSGGSAGEVWKVANAGSTPTRIYPSSGVSALDLTAIINSFRDSPYNLLIGTGSGRLYRIAANSDTLTGPLRNPMDSGTEPILDFGGYVNAMEAFNKAEYIGISNGTNGGEIWRAPDKKWQQFAPTDCTHIMAMAVWNGRLWILGYVRNRLTRLYVTDGNTLQEAYTWKNHFTGRSLYAHYGQLYIAGSRDSFDEAEHTGEIWKYNGATMDLIGSFDSGGLTDIPVFGAGAAHRIDALGSFGRFLVASMPERTLLDGTVRRGLWFYDPEQDAWHVGTYLHYTDFPARSGNFAGVVPTIISMQDFDGCLYMGLEDAAGHVYFLKNDDTEYVKSFYRSSIFDATIPLEDKLFSRVRVDVEIPAYGGKIVTEVSYDRGETWTTLGTQNSTASKQRTTLEYELGSGAGVISKSIQLRITMFPGNGTSTAEVTTGTVTPKLFATVVDWDAVPEKRYQWVFTVIAAEGIMSPDHTVDTRSAKDIYDKLETLSKNRKLFKYKDVDGTEYTCRLLEANTFRPDIPEGDPVIEIAECAVRIQQWY